MPTTPVRIAKDHREIIRQQVIGHTLPTPLVYRGVTTGNTPTEIFILGKTGIATDTTSPRRLWLPESSLVMFEAFVTAYNITDDTLIHAAKYVGGVSNLNDTVAALKDYDGVAGGTQAFILDTVQNVTTAGTVAFAADNTLKALTLTVTGVAAKTIEWMCHFYPQAYQGEISSFYYGDRQAGNSI